MRGRRKEGDKESGERTMGRHCRPYDVHTTSIGAAARVQWRGRSTQTLVLLRGVPPDKETDQESPPLLLKVTMKTYFSLKRST